MTDPFNSRPETTDGSGKGAGDRATGAGRGDELPQEARELKDDTMPKTPAESQAQIDRALGKVDIEVNTRSNTSFAFPIGQGPPFILRRAEFTRTDDRPRTELQPLIDNFLKNLKPIDEDSLSASQSRELDESKNLIANATNTEDAVANALHLAKLYRHLRYIEEAKKAIDLALGIDPDNYYGRQLFKELERMHPVDIGISAPRVLPGPLTRSNLRKRVQALTGGRVIVLGDLLIDELLEGKPERISREAPVLILEHVDTVVIPGGAANTANNVAALGGRCHAIGVCGEDEYAGRLRELFDRAGITSALVTDRSRPTTVKTRILSKSHSLLQQLLRLDRICREPISASIEAQIVEQLNQARNEYGALILSDYRAGIMTDSLIRACRSLSREANLLLIVDAQGDFARFQDVTLITPNQPDAEKAVGFAIDSPESLQRAGEELMLTTGAQAVLITRGAQGMVLFQQNESMVELPAFNKSEVFDVTGAGDTVVATMALALVTGSSFVEAMALGNLAAGIVVKKTGTAVTTQAEMLQQLDLLQLEE